MNPVADIKAPEIKNTSPISPATVKVINKEELNNRMQAGEPFQIVNVLNPEHYNLGFIKGSKKIPLADLDARINELDKSKPVVTYCASRECDASTNAAKKLALKGFNVSAYEGGIKEWKQAGLPTEA